MTAGDNVIISAMHIDKSRFVQIMAMAPRFSGRPSLVPVEAHNNGITLRLLAEILR